MTINDGMATVIGRLVAAGAAIALAAMIVLSGPAFARQVGTTTDYPETAHERTEGEKFANNYGFGNADRDSLVGRTPQEISTHLALARLGRTREITPAQERSEGEKFAQDYGFSDPAEVGGHRVASAPANPVPSDPWGSRDMVTVTGSLVILLVGAGLLIARHQRSRSAI